MDPTTQTVRDFLGSITPVRQSLHDLIPRLYKRPEVKTVRVHAMELAPSTDFGLSAELRNGAVVDFWIELSCEDDRWELKYSVLRHDPDEDGCHPEVEFPPQSIRSISEMPSRLIAAIKALERASENDALYR
jgi:hypothetical protein